MKIDPRNIPPEGLQVVGTRPASFFGLPPDDPVQAISQFAYDLLIIRDDEDLVVTGTLSATFQLECGRCTESFPYKVELTHYATELPIENESPVDLTEPLREDILLALPNHPRCENGNVEPRECPAEGRFDAVTDDASEEQHEEPDRNVWGALDQLQNLKRT